MADPLTEPPVAYKFLRWRDGVWCCDGDPLHPGIGMELLLHDGSWLRTHVHSDVSGRLWLRFIVPGLSPRMAVVQMYEYDQLRWPGGEG
jgi:hypothetical protein